MTKVNLDKLDALYAVLELSGSPADYSDFHDSYPAMRDEILELREWQERANKLLRYELKPLVRSMWMGKGQPMDVEEWFAVYQQAKALIAIAEGEASSEPYMDTGYEPKLQSELDELKAKDHEIAELKAEIRTLKEIGAKQ